MYNPDIRHLPRIRIGEAMRLFGMSARALRFYEEKGLIQPRRDRSNHRVYDGAARLRLGWIGALRAAHVSLPDITEVLEAEERAGTGRQWAIRKIRARRTQLQLQLASTDRA